MHDDKSTRVDNFFIKLKNNRFLAFFIIIGLIVIGLATVTDSFEKLYNYAVKISDSNRNGIIQQQLSGNIFDEIGNPLSGVILSISEYKLTDTTDSYGKYDFLISATEPTSVRMITTKVGYETIISTPTLGNTKNNFTMRHNIK